MPLKGTMIIDSPPATTGQCGEALFPGPAPAPHCAFNPSRSTLRCNEGWVDGPAPPGRGRLLRPFPGADVGPLARAVYCACAPVAGAGRGRPGSQRLLRGGQLVVDDVL